MALVAPGCWNPFSPKQEPGEYPLPLSDSVVLQNLQTSYMAMNIEQYMACLDDSFRFYFDPAEEGIQELLRQYWGIDSLVWGKSEERVSTNTLFNYIRSEDDGSLDLILGQPQWIYRSDTSSLCICDYYLVMYPPVEGESVAEGRAVFTLRKHPDTGFWYILRWEDFGGT